MELVDVADSKSAGLIPRVGSSPTTGTTSGQAMYRLPRLFSKVGARSLRCPSFPTATRCAGLAVGAALRAALRGPHFVGPVDSNFTALCHVGARSLRRPSFPTATRCAGLAVGAALWAAIASNSGKRFYHIAPRRGKLCIACPGFFQKSGLTHAAAPPFPTKPEGRLCGGPILSDLWIAILPHCAMLKAVF